MDAGPAQRWTMRVRALLEQTYEEWRNDRTSRLGAALAYYGVFAIVPLTTLAVAIASFVFSSADVQQWIDERAEDLAPGSGNGDVGAAVADELEQLEVQTTLGAVGLVTLVFAASAVFLAFQDALNAMWHEPVGRGLRRLVRRRVTAFLVVLGTGSILVFSLALSAVAAFVQLVVPSELESLSAVPEVLASFGSWALVALVVMVLFRLLPPEPVSWTAAGVGGVLAAVGMTIGTIGYGLYLRHFGSSSLGGALGAALLVLVWIYYIAQTVLASAQLTKVLSWRGTGQLSSEPSG